MVRAYINEELFEKGNFPFCVEIYEADENGDFVETIDYEYKSTLQEAEERVKEINKKAEIIEDLRAIKYKLFMLFDYPDRLEERGEFKKAELARKKLDEVIFKLNDLERELEKADNKTLLFKIKDIEKSLLKIPYIDKRRKEIKAVFNYIFAKLKSIKNYF